MLKLVGTVVGAKRLWNHGVSWRYLYPSSKLAADRMSNQSSAGRSGFRFLFPSLFPNRNGKEKHCSDAVFVWS